MGTDKIKDRNLDPKLKEIIATKQELEQLQTTINTELENVKKSASDGKASIATAITNKGIPTESDATYATIASNINDIVTLDIGTSDATVTSDKMLKDVVAYGKDGARVVGSIPSQGAQTITPGTSNKTIPANVFLSGVQTIAGDADLISANIKSGANIFGVAGNANIVDTSAGDATAAQIMSGKKAYVDGKLITGTAPTQAAKTWTPTTSNLTIASGTILTGAQTIIGDANLKAANIKSGVEIFGVLGTYNPGISNLSSHNIATISVTKINGGYHSNSTYPNGSGATIGFITFPTMPKFFILPVYSNAAGALSGARLLVFPYLRLMIKSITSNSISSVSNLNGRINESNLYTYGSKSDEYSGSSLAIYFSEDYLTVYFYGSAMNSSVHCPDSICYVY